MKLASRSLLLATLASLAKQLENKQHNFTLYCTHSHARCEKAPRQRLVMNKMQQQTDRHLCLSPPRSEVPPMLGAPKFLETALRTARQPCGVLRELNCRRSFPAAPAGVLRKLKSPVGVARRQSGRERDCGPRDELPPSSPRRSCSPAGPQKILAML